MLVSTNWVKDFVDFKTDLSPVKLGEKVTLATAEVEDVLTTGLAFKKITIARIVSIKKHPEADKLNLVTFKINDSETREVVCGAANVRVGLTVAYAPIGVTLPNGMTLEPKKIRGVLSEGMLCSEEELGFKDESEGIWELPDDAIIGTPLSEYLNITTDIILDIDNKSLTHRPDLWGHYGFAREFAAIFKAPLKQSFDSGWLEKARKQANKQTSPIKLDVAKDSSCLAYFGISLDGIKVTESPSWLKERLNACGLRPINNIVDISNYVMLELGHPLHIFDRSKIEGDTVKVYPLKKDEEFTTLDEASRKLIAGDTVIADGKKSLVIAGIMGGLNSGVDENTTSVFIEVANWKAAEVRQTSTRLGLRTDSSQRFEKTLDSLQCEKVLWRTVELIKQFCDGAQVVGPLESYTNESPAPLSIKTSTQKISKYLGKEIETKEIVSIFESLDFTVKNNNGELIVDVPSFRATKDIEIESDLIEEIGRMIGYDNIEPVSPKWDIAPASLDYARKVNRKAKDYLVYSAKALEVMTYPMTSETALKKALWPILNNELTLVNSMSEDQDRMRPTLIPQALEVAAKNQKNYSSFRFFEWGRSYLPAGDFAEERPQLLIGFYNKSESPLIDLLNETSGLLNSLGVSFDLVASNPKFKNTVIPEDWKGCHPQEYVNLRVMGKLHGAITSVHPILLKNYKIKGHLALAVIDWKDILARPLKDKTKYRPLPKFPSSTFDWTVVTKKNTSVSDVLQALKKVKLKELTGVTIVGTYPLNDEETSVTLRATFQDPAQTLASDFIKSAEDKLVKTLEAAGYPLKS